MAHISRDGASPRLWPRRVLIAANVFVALCVLATAAGYGYIRLKYGQIDKIDLCNALRRCGDDDAGGPMNVLLVGSDTRETISAEDRKHFGSADQVGGQRSDTIMVLHVDPRVKKAAILSIPRDTYVKIADTGRSDRVNTAYERGPKSLIDTITKSLGIPIDHYASVDFVGFRGIVDSVGGVVIPFPAPARDTKTGLSVKSAGCINLTGEQALAYARSRQFQTFESGRWRTDPTGDLGRIQRQQDFVRRVMRKAISKGARQPFKLPGLVNQGVKYVKIDRALSTKDILRLGSRFRSLEPDAVDMLTLPATNVFVGGAAVLRLKEPDAQEIIDHFNGKSEEPSPASPPPNIKPNTVRVRVLNGSGLGGQGGTTAKEMQRQGFNIAGTGDAEAFTYTKPVVRYGRGQILKAQLVAAYIEGGAELKQDLNLQGVDVVLTTGSRFGGIRAPGTAAASTTTVVTTNGPATTKPQSKGAPTALNC
ncbi:MAG: LCP family protein [Actinobacteria bacterium]|nr:LCP family protein [Actinomycetota bacterium]